MTPEETFWRRIQRLAGQLQPELSRALSLALSRLRAALPEAELARLLEQGDVLDILTLLDETSLDLALAPLVIAIRESVKAGIASGVATVREAVPLLAVRFNVDPKIARVAAPSEALSAKVLAGIKADLRATALQIVERSPRDGVAPRVVARELRASLGLGPAQERQVQNFRRALETGDTAKALGYELRYKRLDKSIRAGTLSREQIDTLVNRYRNARIAQNAEAITRTAALDVQRLGQQIAWEEAVAQGLVEPDKMRRRWVTILDGRERPTHKAMNKTVVRFDEPFYVKGEGKQMQPGTLSWNCRCVAWVFTARD